MAFKNRSRPLVDFANLVVGLNKTGLNVSNQPLYQVIKDLIDKSQQSIAQLNSIFQSFVGDINIDDNADLQAILNQISTINAILQDSTFLVTLDESNNLPNSRRLLAGAGILFDDTVPFERTISSTGSGSSFIPMVNGNEPPELMSNGAGDLLLISYN